MVYSTANYTYNVTVLHWVIWFTPYCLRITSQTPTVPTLVSSVLYTNFQVQLSLLFLYYVSLYSTIREIILCYPLLFWLDWFNMVVSSYIHVDPSSIYSWVVVCYDFIFLFISFVFIYFILQHLDYFQIVLIMLAIINSATIKGLNSLWNNIFESLG